MIGFESHSFFDKLFNCIFYCSFYFMSEFFCLLMRYFIINLDVVILLL